MIYALLTAQALLFLTVFALWIRMRRIAREAWRREHAWGRWWLNTPDGARIRSWGLVVGHPLTRLREGRYPTEIPVGNCKECGREKLGDGPYR